MRVGHLQYVRKGEQDRNPIQINAVAQVFDFTWVGLNTLWQIVPSTNRPARLDTMTLTLVQNQISRAGTRTLLYATAGGVGPFQFCELTFQRTGEYQSQYMAPIGMLSPGQNARAFIDSDQDGTVDINACMRGISYDI